MEIREEDEQLGSIGKTQRIKISRRDTIVNDLKNSTAQGIVSLLLSILSAGILGTAVYMSYAAAGNAGYLVGIMVIGALAAAVISIVCGIAGLKNRKKIRHYMERRGIVISAVLIALMIAGYVWGVFLYLEA